MRKGILILLLVLVVAAGLFAAAGVFAQSTGLVYPVDIVAADGGWIKGLM